MVTYFAACTLGLEQVLADELRALGAGDVAVRPGATSFTGDAALGYRACLWLHSAIRVQEELARGRVRDRDDLYELTASVDWSRSITHLQTLAVDASVRDSFANDTRFPVLVVKDAVVDQFRDRTGKRPDVGREEPDLPIKLVLHGCGAILYRDLAGRTLHKRGYREAQHKSPLNESLAAGLVLLTDWDRQGPLCDPMCGSGTLLIEAALLAMDRAPGLGRAFAFERWRDVDLEAWNRILAEAEQRASAGAERRLVLLGNDRHPGSIALARKAAATAEVAQAITWQQQEVHDYAPTTAPQWIVTNPPWGERLEGEGDRVQGWRDLGAFLRERCPGATAFVLSGDAELTRHLGLRAERKCPVRNGPVDCRWLCYRIDARTDAPRSG